ncbi:MAG: M20/M25/M40 family metallo-hydrolase [Acidobacteria bacterium]|nr:M20/M25/M40 family metallo-hydrolase [Acidobacteriota bacterium]
MKNKTFKTLEKFRHRRYSLIVLLALFALLLVVDDAEPSLVQRVTQHVYFLADDALLGRATPSGGLDRAASYIMDQFKSEGLKPINDEYAHHVQADAYVPMPITLSTDLRDAQGLLISALKDTVASQLIWRHLDDYKALNTLLRHEAATLPRGPRTQAEFAAIHQTQCGLMVIRVQAPEQGSPHLSPLATETPLVAVNSDTWNMLRSSGTVTFQFGASKTTPIDLLNPVGILRGSDPSLAETYVVVGAHYDHVGHALADDIPRGPMNGDGDLIWNGANDNASSIAALIECARLLRRNPPKRSVLFVAFFGEELGLLGSSSFVQNPPVPLKSMMAMINLEQLGRTDDMARPDGIKPGALAMTGFYRSTLPAQIQRLAESGTVSVYAHPEYSEAYFRRSDNAPFVDAGIPAHTISASFSFPDYHQPTDHREQIDYDYLARVTEFLSKAVTDLGNSPDVPTWLP